MTDQNVIDPKDLDLIPQTMVDEGKDEAEIWNEIVAAEDAARAGKEPPQTAPHTALQAQESTAVAPEAKEGQESPTAAPQAAQAPDIWATATPEQRAAYDALVADRAKLEQKARSAEGRATAHQRKIDELYRQMQPSNDDVAGKLRQSRQALTAKEADYPEIINPVAQVLDAVNENLSQLSAAEQRRREAATAELAEIVREEEAKLAEIHPDWEDVLSKHGGPQFAAWVEDQPRRFRDAFARNANAIVDAASVAEFMSAYKAHLGIVPANAPAAPPPNNPPNNALTERRERQLAATASPTRSVQRPVVSGIPEDADDESAWNQIVAERARQRA